MPVEHGVGYNPHNTPFKQEALDGLAGHLLGAVAAVAEHRRTAAVVLDLTCGPGLYGAVRGSPLIFAKHVESLRKKYMISLVCVDRSKRNIKSLQATMRAYYPGVPVRYGYNQREVLASLSPGIVGLAYLDPTSYKDHDIDLLRYMGERFRYLDILFTYQGVAYTRLKGAAHTRDWARGMEDFLNATGKRYRYVVELARYNWWCLGFADNWDARPSEKLSWRGGKLWSIDTPAGKALLDRLMKRQKEPPCEQLTLFGSDEPTLEPTPILLSSR